MPETSTLPASPLHALCVYAEPLVAGRRVVVFGDVSHRLGERFLDLGARVVHVYDPQAARATAASDRAPRGLTVQPLPPGDFDVRDGAFDVAVVADISEIPSPASLLARIRRLLAPGGVALVRARAVESAGRGRPRPGPAPVDYYELYDLVALQFAHVRMVGQIPWAGVALAELGRTGDEPDVTVDTQLVLEADPPEAFVAVGSQEDVRLAEYALVQVPLAPSVDVEATIMYGSERANLAAAQLRASLLDAQLEELKATRNAEGVRHAESLAAVDAELANRLGELQEAERRFIDTSTRVEAAASDVRARDEELARVRDRAALGVKELEDERRQRARAETELKGSRERLAAAALDAQALSMVRERLPRLEAAIGELEAAVADREQRLAAALLAKAKLETALASVVDELESAREGQSQEAGEIAGEASAVVVELEAKVARLEAEVAVLGDGHGLELAAFEQALRERARVTQVLEQELARRERIILDLVHAFDEAHALEQARAGREHTPVAPGADTSELDAALRDSKARSERLRGENDELRRKLDASALEIARREGESTTSSWRIQELEQAVARLEDEQSELTMTIPPPAFLNLEREANDVTLLTQRLAAAEDELDVLRQALAQEHAARVRAQAGVAGDGADAQGATST